MAQIVAAALVSHGSLVAGRPVGASVIPQISYTLNKVLTAVARQHAIKDGLSDANMAGVELSPAERTALKDGDITGLYHLGANLYLIRRVYRAR